MANLMEQEIAGLKKDVMALRDEVRLKIHLANMDLKTEWEKLEPRVEKMWGEVSDATIKAGQEMKKRFQEIREQLKKN